ncbi:MAG: glycosyltransferase [Sphingomonadaceae bacterium]
MPHILFDVSRMLWRAWGGQRATGIDRACLAYITHHRNDALAVVQRGGFTHVLSKAASVELFGLLLSRPKLFRRRLLALLLRSLLTRERPLHGMDRPLYLNVSHTGLDQKGHARWVRRSSVRAVYMVYDLIPLTHPQFAREGIPERHVERMRLVLKEGRGVIAISDDSLDTLSAFAGHEGLALPSSMVAPLGVTSLVVRADRAAPIAGPYFVILGTIEGRKNHLLLLRVWRRLIEQLGDDAPKLVIIGQRGWCAEEVFKQLDHDLTLRSHVIEVGPCDDDTLSEYMAHARALLFPTFVEGQGLPLTEALGAGVPAIASNLVVFKETAGGIPDYLDPEDDTGWEQAVMDYAEPESTRRAAQIERMHGFVPPTWEAHFAKVDAWLTEQGLLP